MKNKKILLIIGTILAYLGLYLVPSLRYFPIPIGIFFLFSYKYFGDFKKALFLTAIFSLPFSRGKSLLPTDDNNLLNVTSFVAGIILLAFLSVKNRVTTVFSWQDLFLALFFLLGIFSFIFINTAPETLDGLFTLGIAVLFYFIAKVYLQDKQVKYSLVFILISIIVFESSITIIQFFLHHPIGRYIEEGINLYPFGRLASETATIFRPSGTMSEPTWMARFFTMLLPFAVITIKKTFFPFNSKVKNLIIIMLLLAIFATFTRVSWAVASFLLVFIYIYKKPKIAFVKIKKSTVFIFFSTAILFTIALFPYFSQRVFTSSLSFQEGGSFDLRIKLIQEAANLIEQYPLFGVGLNRFQPFAQENNITNFFENYITPVHNVPLLIASEMGIPALILFIGFIVLSYTNYLQRRKLSSNTTINYLDAAALGGIVYILESQMGTIFLSPHLSLFFLYIAIITV